MAAISCSPSPALRKPMAWRIVLLTLLTRLCDGKPSFTIDLSKNHVEWGQPYNLTWQNSVGRTWIDLAYFPIDDTSKGMWNMNIVGELPPGTTWYQWNYDFTLNPNNLSHRVYDQDPTDFSKTDYYAFEVADESSATSRKEPNLTGLFYFYPNNSTSASPSSPAASSTQSSSSSGATSTTADAATTNSGGISDAARNGAIAGSIVGGVIIFVVVGWFCCLKRRQHSTSTDDDGGVNGEKGSPIVQRGPHELGPHGMNGAPQLLGADALASPKLGSDSTAESPNGVRRVHSITSNTSELNAVNQANVGLVGITAGRLQDHDAASGAAPPMYQFDPMAPSELSQVSAAHQQPLPVGQELSGYHHDPTVRLVPSELSQTSAMPPELGQFSPEPSELSQVSAAQQQPLPVGRELSSDSTLVPPQQQQQQQQRGASSPPPVQYQQPWGTQHQLAPVAEFPADHAHQQAAEVSASPATYQVTPAAFPAAAGDGQSLEPMSQHQQQYQPGFNYAPAQSPVPSEHGSYHQLQQQQQQPRMMSPVQPMPMLSHHQSLRQVPGQRVVSDPSHTQQPAPWQGASVRGASGGRHSLPGPGQQQQQLSRSASLPLRPNFCPNCGMQSGGQHNFCGNCGNQLV